MDREDKLRALVPRLEQMANAHPWRYRFAVLALALLGYAFLGASVIVLLLATVGVAAIAVLSKNPLLIKALFKVFWIPLLIAGAIVKALWVRIQAPEGLHVTRREAPRLIDEVERIRRAIGAPRIHRVLLTDEFNAAAVTVPLLGVFGWHRRYLVLGLPLMLALDRDGLATVIAHEFGHFRGGDTRFANWIYRVRRTWWQLLEGLARDGRGGFLRRFFDWYAPYFDAYSFVLARQNEYDADAAAASLVGPRQAARALISVSVVSQHLSTDYWPQIYRRADLEPAPPASAYVALAQAVAGIDRDARARHLAHSARGTTDHGDTHPSLGDRVRALGQVLEDVEPPSESSAKTLLGDALDGMLREFDTRWCAGVDRGWRERYQQCETERARLAALRERETEGATTLTTDERCEMAALIESHGSEDDARARYLAILAEEPAHASASFALGRLTLATDVDVATRYFDIAIARDPDAAEPAYRHLIARYDELGDIARRDETIAKLKRCFADAAAAAEERRVVTTKDSFLPHGLDDVALGDLREALARITGVRTAWLVRKATRLRPDVPHYVLLVKLYKKDDETSLQRAANVGTLSGSVIAISAAAHARVLTRTIERVSQGPLMTRG